MEVKMKNSAYFKTITFPLAALFALSVILASVAFAADDPSIKGSLRDNIKTSMMTFIEKRMVDDTFIIYDAVDGRLMKLKYDKLHDGIIKKRDFYVSCADFFDEKGRKVDLDFLVIRDGDNLHTIQAVIHAIDGKKRKYHLEN
jgi:hypothetical protein